MSSSQHRILEFEGHEPAILCPSLRIKEPLRRPAKRGMLAPSPNTESRSGETAMPTQIGENRAKKMLKNNELVLCMGEGSRLPQINAGWPE
jgi:hypothetical protein